MPSISRKRTRKNRALKRTRKINSRRVRKNSQSAGGIFGSTGTKISGFFKNLKSKTPKVSFKLFDGLKRRLSRKKNTTYNNAKAPLLNDSSVSPSNSAGNGNANKANTGKAKQPTNVNRKPANGNGNRPANGNQPKNGNNTKPPVNNPQSTNGVPLNTPVNGNKPPAPTNGGNGQNKNKNTKN